MVNRRRGPTAESRARAARIAEALSGMLEDLPAPDERPGAPSDPYRPLPPRRVAQKSTRMRCPACGEAMYVDFDRGVELDRCLGCGGLWLDVGELKELSRTTVTDPQPSPAALRREMEGHTAGTHRGPVRYRKCPRCQDVMHRRNFGTLSGVIVDECPRHGVFLDPEELEAIERFIELGGLALQQRTEEDRIRQRERRAARLEAQARKREYIETARERAWWIVFDWFT